MGQVQMIMDKLLMQSDLGQGDGLCRIHRDIADGRILVAVHALEGKRPGARGYIPELIVAAPEGYRVDRIGTVDAHDECATPGGNTVPSTLALDMSLKTSI